MVNQTISDEGFLDEHEDLLSWVYDEDLCFWMKFPFQGRSLRKSSQFKGKRKSGKSKGGKGSSAHRFFRPYRKEEARARSLGKGSSSSASKANVAEEDIEEEEAEDDAPLTDKQEAKEKATSKEEEQAATARLSCT